MGMMYQRGKVWWIKYYRNGRYYRESTGTTKKMVAQKHLERREGEIAQGKMPGILFKRSPSTSWPRTFCGTTGSTRKNRSNKQKGV